MDTNNKDKSLVGAAGDRLASDEIHVLGNELLKTFQDEIMSVLEKNLSVRWGEDWLSLCTISDSDKFLDVKKDLQFTLKQIVQKNNGNFRLALSQELFQTDWLKKEQLESLAKIQEFRNLWAHPDTDSMTLSLLRKLASAIVGFYGTNENNLVEYCNFILGFNESDGEAIPKILVNSSIFKRHLSGVDNIMKSIDENANLMGKIIDLNRKMEEFRKSGVDGKGLVPGFSNMTYDDLQESFKITLHMSQAFLGAYYAMNLKLAVADLRLMIQIKNTSENTKIKRLIGKWNKDGLPTLNKQMKKLMDSRNAIDFPKDCDCQFCSNIDGSNIGAMDSIGGLERLLDQISPPEKE